MLMSSVLARCGLPEDAQVVLENLEDDPAVNDSVFYQMTWYECMALALESEGKYDSAYELRIRGAQLRALGRIDENGSREWE